MEDEEEEDEGAEVENKKKTVEGAKLVETSRDHQMADDKLSLVMYKVTQGSQ